MRLRATHEGRAVIPTASMADIAFLLIIFFMVTFTSEVDRAQVTLPKTELRFEVPRQAAYVSVTENGIIKVSNGEELSVVVSGVEDVLSFAAGVVSTDPSKAFVIKADTNVPYRTIDRIIDSLKQAKVTVIYLLSQQATTEDGGG
jgi:biopolymer transport protein ExbD